MYSSLLHSTISVLALLMLTTACGSTASESPPGVAAEIPTDVPAGVMDDEMGMEEDVGHDHTEVTDGTETLAGDTSQQTYHLVVADGEVQSPGRIEIDLGSVVQLHIHSDVSDEIHVHGYDILRTIEPGGEAEINFVANLPGVWETEMETSGLVLIELVVS